MRLTINIFLLCNVHSSRKFFGTHYLFMIFIVNLHHQNMFPLLCCSVCDINILQTLLGSPKVELIDHFNCMLLQLGSFQYKYHGIFGYDFSLGNHLSKIAYISFYIDLFCTLAVLVYLIFFIILIQSPVQTRQGRPC